jgi:TRAP-type C4-dicarboxylate transport system substrate-binding protein
MSSVSNPKQVAKGFYNGKKIVLMVLVASLLFSSYASAEVIKLKFANYFPPMHMNSVMMGKYCEELNVKLAGKVELTQYAGGTLLTAPKMAAGVASGIAPISASQIARTQEVASLPWKLWSFL